jgi:predicted nucleotidyltransferase
VFKSLCQGKPLTKKANNMPARTALEMDPAEWRNYRPFHSQEPLSAESVRASEARKVADKLALELKGRFAAKKVVLFGSLARREFSGRSDIDLAVWGIPPGKFYRVVAFASGFSEVWAIDLVDGEDCPESLLLNIEQEGIAL